MLNPIHGFNRIHKAAIQPTSQLASLLATCIHMHTLEQTNKRIIRIMLEFELSIDFDILIEFANDAPR